MGIMAGILKSPLEGAKKAFDEELEKWMKRCFERLIVMTEYGADTIQDFTPSTIFHIPKSASGLL